MKLNTGIALMVACGAVLLASCAAQQGTVASGVAQSGDAAEPIDSEVLQEIKLNARNVPVAAVPKESEIVCERVAPTGSFIPKQRCQTREARRQETEQAQEWLRSDGSRGAISEVR